MSYRSPEYTLHLISLAQLQMNRLNERMKKVSRLRAKRIMRAYRLGVSVRTIANETGIAEAIVYRILRNYSEEAGLKGKSKLQLANLPSDRSG